MSPYRSPHEPYRHLLHPQPTQRKSYSTRDRSSSSTSQPAAISPVSNMDTRPNTDFTCNSPAAGSSYQKLFWRRKVTSDGQFHSPRARKIPARTGLSELHASTHTCTDTRVNGHALDIHACLCITGGRGAGAACEHAACDGQIWVPIFVVSGEGDQGWVCGQLGGRPVVSVC